ncbi:MAG: shikimate dehydrogenase [Gammaproteobacteria bacterium CG11_big_fil_rev_8_21_14_0_20_46_22]|nr:MAG: shikimate dehydrogenase [Gammaproteobacteria bacterium CG12_big_fil_rev_8_21_14_0_65_46_12]PIR10567.1 MAG: shikimate dehydrogenase [Gammaproteobacteria bacterium CG11_big_fil_rev_8_21_14_0_20_46_22]
MFCALVGNPVDHSLSPLMYVAFCEQWGISDFRYETYALEFSAFESALAAFQQEGIHSLNITTPFKSLALACATDASTRARRAGAANLLTFDDNKLIADNTDGEGLLRDISMRWGLSLQDRTVVVLGAGGAARGALAALMSVEGMKCFVVNRTLEKAQYLAEAFEGVRAASFDSLASIQADLIINATSSSLQGVNLPVPAEAISTDTYVYDMFYTKNGHTHFLSQMKALGAVHCRDGLGMLLEQGALVFEQWFGQVPEIGKLIEDRTWLHPR